MIFHYVGRSTGSTLESMIRNSVELSSFGRLKIRSEEAGGRKVPESRLRDHNKEAGKGISLIWCRVWGAFTNAYNT